MTDAQARKKAAEEKKRRKAEAWIMPSSGRNRGSPWLDEKDPTEHGARAGPRRLISNRRNRKKECRK